MAQACDWLAGYTDSGEAAVLKKAVPAKPAVRTVSTGLGIVITPNGHILTNEHVVRQCDAYPVVCDSTRILKNTIWAADAARDLWLLAVEESFPNQTGRILATSSVQGEMMWMIRITKPPGHVNVYF